MAVKAAFVHNPFSDGISYGEQHPFVAARAGMTLALCRKRGLVEPPFEHVNPPPATRQDLEVFHDPAYLDVLESANRGEVTEDWLRYGLGTEDCPVFAGVMDFSLAVAGGSLESARMVADGRFDRVFHPSGGLHHAMPDQASGFCYVNDVVLAVMELRRRGLRVATVDIDAHHGDGTQAAFESNPDVLTVSVHQSGKTQFPGTGFESELGRNGGLGYTLNVPLPVDTFDGAFVEVMSRVVVPAVRNFRPDVLVTQVGADTLGSDPLTQLALTNNGIADAVQLLANLDLPWMVVGGGGYNVDATVRAWTLVWSVVSDQPLEDPYAGLIGGMMTGLSEVEGGDLRDRPQYVTPERRQQVEAELAPVLAFLEKQLDRIAPAS